MTGRATSVALVAERLFGDEQALHDEITKLIADGWSWRRLRDHYLLQSGVAVDSQTYARWYRRRVSSAQSPTDAPTVEAGATPTASGGEQPPTHLPPLASSATDYLHRRSSAEVESAPTDRAPTPSGIEVAS